MKKNYRSNERMCRGGETKISVQERYEMIRNNQRSYCPIPVKRSANLLGVSKSGYYSWLKRNGHDRIAARDRLIIEEMHKIIHKYPGYGYRRMTRQLRWHVYIVNHKRVLRLMRENGLIFKNKTFHPITTDSEHANPVHLLYSILLSFSLPR
ncbi:MAG: transposase [Methanomassiliicoccales archaeon]|nr:MAG: transposase [Methanomassiliicoccales archaeon]